MSYIDKVEEAVAFRLVSDGYSGEMASAISRRVFRNIGPESNDIRVASGALVSILWPVISNPSIGAVIKSIKHAVDGQLEKEIFQGRVARSTATYTEE